MDLIAISIFNQAARARFKSSLRLALINYLEIGSEKPLGFITLSGLRSAGRESSKTGIGRHPISAKSHSTPLRILAVLAKALIYLNLNHQGEITSESAEP